MLKIQQLSSRYSQYKEQLKAKNLLLYPFDKIRAYSFSLLVIYHDVITLSKIHMFIETKKKKKKKKKNSLEALPGYLKACLLLFGRLNDDGFFK